MIWKLQSKDNKRQEPLKRWLMTSVMATSIRDTETRWDPLSEQRAQRSPGLSCSYRTSLSVVFSCDWLPELQIKPLHLTIISIFSYTSPPVEHDCRLSCRFFISTCVFEMSSVFYRGTSAGSRTVSSSAPAAAAAYLLLSQPHRR